MSTSIRILAEEFGVNPSTISRALRGTGNISPEMREKVRRRAKEVGYEINPLISKALSLARQPSPRRYRETLAFILEFPTKDGPDYQIAMQDGAMGRAQSLFYKLETFILSTQPEEHRRMSRVFVNRGIRGLIFLPRLLHAQPRLHMDWEKFAAVEIGRTLWQPRNLHRVETASYHSMLEALHLLKRVGYKRIGMAVETMYDYQSCGAYFAPFLLMQQRLPRRQRIPIFAIENEWTGNSFKRWMLRYKPDVIFAHHVTHTVRWLQRMKLSIPGDVSVFNINVRQYDNPGPHRDYDWTGFKLNYAGMGRRAVEMVTNLLDNSEFGLVGDPISWQIEQLWVPGQTLSLPIDRYITEDGFLKNRFYKNTGNTNFQRRPMVPAN